MTIQWIQEPAALGYTPLEQCSQDCYLKYGAQSGNVDAAALLACFAHCDVVAGQPPVVQPDPSGGGITIPGGFTLPAGWAFPAGWTLPGNWSLPSSWNIPGFPGGVTPPTGLQLPFGWQLPADWTLPGPLTLPPGTPLPPAPAPLQCPQGQTWDGVNCVTPGAAPAPVPGPVTTTTPPAKDNTIWWVLGGLAVLGGVAWLALGRRGANVVQANPVKQLPGGGFAEVGVFEHEGQKYTAGGSFYDPKAGILIGYPHRTATGWELRQWDGKHIGALHLRSTFKGGFGRSKIYAWHMTYDGRSFSGRNSGENMFLRMRAKP